MRAWLAPMLLCVSSSFASAAFAGEWCALTEFGISENSGTVSVSGYLNGTYRDWLVINRTNDSDAVKKRLAMLLAAKAAGQSVTFFIDSPYTCATVPNWTNDVVVHVRVQ